MVLVAGATALPCSGVTHAPDAAFGIELAAAKHVLTQRDRPIRLDSAFAIARTAPGERTDQLRPSARTKRLADSLEASVSALRTGAGTYLLMSAPDLSGATAAISVTVVYPPGRTGSIMTYETLELTLQRDRATWHVVKEVQLGIS